MYSINNNTVNVVILPASGTSFPVQIGLMSQICKVDNFKPTLMLGCSGGNATAYLTLAANFNSEQILKLAEKIEGYTFAKPWSIIIPSYIVGFWKGTVYNKTANSEKFFKSIIKQDSINKVEIWSIATNRHTSNSQLFCNLKKEDSILKPKRSKILMEEEAIYANCDIDMIAKFSIASASIPIFVPEVLINGISYSDGGMIFSSPVSANTEELEKLFSNYEKIRMYYISSYDMDQPITTSYNNIVKNAGITLKQLLRSKSIEDRFNSIKLLGREENIKYEHGQCNIVKLLEIENKRDSYSSSLLELYVKVDLEVDIVKMSPAEILEIIAKTVENYNYRLWYID